MPKTDPQVLFNVVGGRQQVSQSLWSQRALAQVHAMEALGLRKFFRAGTPPKLHAITDRASRKAEARARALNNHNVEREVAFFKANPRRKTLPKGYDVTSWGAERQADRDYREGLKAQASA